LFILHSTPTEKLKAKTLAQSLLPFVFNLRLTPTNSTSTSSSTINHTNVDEGVEILAGAKQTLNN